MKITIPTEGEPDERGFYRIPNMTIYPDGKVLFHDGRDGEIVPVFLPMQDEQGRPCMISGRQSPIRDRIAKFVTSWRFPVAIIGIATGLFVYFSGVLH